MSLYIWRYKLVPRRALSPAGGSRPRHGALLRIDDGFADLHPWPELGDPTLDEQLTLLARGTPTPQTQASLRLASIDGDARRRGVSLFDGLAIPPSHWPGTEPPDGFDTVKIKEPLKVADWLRVRIDFNARLTAAEFLRVAATLRKSQIDFVEDPCPYDESTWRELRAKTGLRLAIDRVDGWADVVVHKPALRAEFPSHADVVVTSYMDHPVGQFGAAYIAARHRVNPRCGLFTHVLYENDAFVERVRSDGARLLSPQGTGLGFDDLLSAIPWQKL